MKTLQWYSDFINGHINDLITSAPFTEEPKGLYDPIAYTLAAGGKRLRPVLLLSSCDACGGDSAKAVNQAMGIEMYHNFTLLHDDVMDRADVRRGRPTVHIKWDDSTAILSGDAMLTMASQLMMRQADADTLRPLLELFNRTAMEVYEGQQYDMDFEHRTDVTVDEYIEMIRLKTSVLLGCACKLGAIVAGAPQATADSMYDYGITLGLAFQLQDDYLDTFGDPNVFGKAIGGDILNDKKTYLLISLLQSLDPAGRAEVEALYGIRSDEKIATVRALYERHGIDRLCREAIDDYSRRAEEAVMGADIPADAKEFFVALARKASSRKF